MVLRGLLKLLACFLIAALLLGIILGVGGYFALRNFDPNMFRKQCESFLSEKTGLLVELGDIQLQWRPQPQLQVGSFKLSRPGTLQTIMTSEQVRIVADLSSVWKKRFVISQVLLQNPEFFVFRDRKGIWIWQSAVNASPVPARAPVLASLNLIPIAEASEGGRGLVSPDLRRLTQGWELGLARVLLRNTTVHFIDETNDPVLKTDITQMDAEIRQRSSRNLYHFTAAAAVLAAQQRNLEAEGDLDLSEKELDLTLRYAGEALVFKGHVKQFIASPRFEGTLDVRGLDIGSVTPQSYKRGEYLDGRLDAKVQFSFEGVSRDQIFRSLVGKGDLEVKDGALRNKNVVQEVFERLSPVLSSINAMGGELPPEVNEMLKGSDTPFQSLKISCAAASAGVKVSSLQLMHPSYQLSGQGNYALLEERVDGVMQLQLSKSISAHLVKKIREMEFLTDAENGMIAIPFRVSGVFPDVSVQPDVAAIGAKVLQGGASQALSLGAEKLSKMLSPKKKGAPSSQASGGTPVSGDRPIAGAPSEQDLLIQQGMALFKKYKETEATQPVSDTSSSTASQGSDREELIRQGMELLSKYRGAQKQ